MYARIKISIGSIGAQERYWLRIRWWRNCYNVDSSWCIENSKEWTKVQCPGVDVKVKGENLSKANDRLRSKNICNAGTVIMYYSWYVE